MPPFEWDFPVYNTHKVCPSSPYPTQPHPPPPHPLALVCQVIGQRLRNYVANGNMLILSGGLMEVEFINTYFFYNVEPADGNYSPGPFKVLPDVPEAMKDCPKVLPQKGIAVTAVKKESLPSGAQVLWGTPHSSAVFMIKFCEAASPQQGMSPVKVLPRDCDASAKLGRPCSCGHIMYTGYNFRDQYPSRWDYVVRAAVEILNPSSEIALKKAEAAKKDDASTQSLSSSSSRASRKASTQATGEASSDVSTVTSSSEGVDQKIAMRKLEIAHLEGTLGTLEDERKAVHSYTAKKAVGGGARTVELDELRDQAKVLIEKIKDEEGGKQEAVKPLGEGVQHLILKSVAALAQDVRQIDSKVNRLEGSRGGEGKGERDRRGERDKRSRRGGRREERWRREGRGREAGTRRGGGRAQAEIAGVKAEEAKKVAAYKHKIESVDKELAFEQAIPSPQEEGEEGSASSSQAAEHCGTLCKLKKLVQKTRSSITKELDGAMN